MARVALLSVLLSLFTNMGFSQNAAWHNTDSLLSALSGNGQINRILQAAETVYKDAGIDTGNISLACFKVAYLQKQMIDERLIRIRHRRWYRNKRVITIIDYSKKGNRERFATIDLINHKIIFDTLVSHGSGKRPANNDKYLVPTFFSNTVNSEVSSLGLIATQKARQTHNPCHLCKYALSQKHEDVVVLRGLERGINNNMKKRDIVMHTTGSADLGGTAKKMLKIKDDNYHVAPGECKCYRTADDGKPKGVAAYASACGITENGGYMGQSNGCLVLPEDNHIAIMNTIKRKSLIFVYSNVATGDYDYFRDSPLMRKIVKYSGK